MIDDPESGLYTITVVSATSMVRKEPLYPPVTAGNTISGTGSHSDNSAFRNCGASDREPLMGITYLLDETLMGLRHSVC